MKTVMPQLTDLLSVMKEKPAVSIVLPFEPYMVQKYAIERRLRNAVKKAEKLLLQRFPGAAVLAVIQRLENLLASINYLAFKKSLAIFVSPDTAKIIYLDIPVEERIVVDESFEIRDLLHAGMQKQQYLLLTLSGRQSKVFLGNEAGLKCIKFNSAERYQNDIPEPVSNFSDPSSRKEVLNEKFLYHVDTGLTMVLNSYPFPVFVMGVEKLCGHFSALTGNTVYVANYIHGNYDEYTEAGLMDKLKPYLANWQQHKQQVLLNQIEQARDAGKLCYGMRDVWQMAAEKRGRLLVVEKVYQCHAYAMDDETIFTLDKDMDTPFYIKDAVDDVIEKVLQSGGSVEFVDDGLLNDYRKIALISYYRL